MELWTGALSWWKCHWADLKSAGLFRWNLSWTPLKPQHSNPNPLANQLRCSEFLTPPTPLIIPYRLPAFLESLMPLKSWCSIQARCSKNRILLHIVLIKCPHVQIAFLKFTSCDNQALVGCIPIASVAVHLNLKSEKLVSHLIRCIAITYWIFKSLRQF